MNTRLLYILLFVQFFFAGALLYVGVQVREKRRQDYLELTHRATSGRASKSDFEKLAQFIPDRAEKPDIRTLFGPPLVRADAIELDDNGKLNTLKGESWLYYFAPVIKDLENPPPPIDAADVEKFSGPQSCFVISFNERGRATARVATVSHPLPPRKP